jgi:nitroimidazol reductase NimA-like FMN-containing flavoprotein (pyridoxamine 5'-phosphate oxidase superfamily)
MPVNYAYVDGEVLFRTGEGTKLNAATQRAVVAFEVDAYDADSASGWSVLVIGRSSVVTDPTELARLGDHEITPWANRTRNNYVRLRPELVTGRRITPG